MAKRDSNIEILRVVAMLFVVLAHFIGWGTEHNSIGPITVSFTNGFIANSLIHPFLTSLAATGVICYVAITSYYICESNVVRLDRAAKTWLPTFFYSVVISFVALLFGQCSKTGFLKSFFPLGTDEYWFVTKYIALVLIAPFLSLVIKQLSNKGHLVAIAILIFLDVTITHGFPYGKVFFPEGASSVSTFVLIFFIASYVRKYQLPDYLENNAGWIAAGCILFQGLGGIAMNIIYHADSVIYGGFSVGYNALTLIPATALFVWFKNRSFRDTLLCRFIVRLAPYTFAVYLIHDNPIIRELLWNRLIDPAEYWQSPLWLALVAIVPICILLMCSLIDALRCGLFKVCRVDKLIEKIAKHNIILE